MSTATITAQDVRPGMVLIEHDWRLHVQRATHYFVRPERAVVLVTSEFPGIALRHGLYELVHVELSDEDCAARSDVLARYRRLRACMSPAVAMRREVTHWTDHVGEVSPNGLARYWAAAQYWHLLIAREASRVDARPNQTTNETTTARTA